MHSAARAIRRGCGFTGWTSRVWLTFAMIRGLPARDPPMQALIDFLPLLAFVVAYYLRDVYFATGVLMFAMPLMLLASWLVLKKVSPLQLMSTALVLGFGGLTLFLRDPRFLQWKPTIFLWGVAIVFAVVPLLGREPLVKAFLAPVASDREVTRAQWRGLNVAWIAFYLLLGAVNLVVARNAS
ncbi:MAG: hypothetical protein EOP08_05375, partial [Proteobacteria bacterium]